ncbi:D(1C) dopamine receptor-like [Dendronephthya gigantea]|uniref:D(1C) dopamine receptor-like n=1 Tax=Dendronephthya gigantea TaxID=151771 RepID=UPI00106C96F0|nr:D(1C) dopamine receptor-like [Dendronephthya gigantea]
MRIILILIIICIIVGNTLVLVATWRERSLHQPNKYFIACLAVADLLVGLFLAPMQVYNLRFLLDYKFYSASPLSDSGGVLETGSWGRCREADDPMNFYLTLFIIVFLLPTLVILVMYVLIFRVARKRQKMLRNGELGQASIDLNQQTAVHRQDMKVIRLLVIIMGVFMLCWSPWFILVYYSIFGDYSNLNEWVRYCNDVGKHHLCSM